MKPPGAGRVSRNPCKGFPDISQIEPRGRLETALQRVHIHLVRSARVDVRHVTVIEDSGKPLARVEAVDVDRDSDLPADAGRYFLQRHQTVSAGNAELDDRNRGKPQRLRHVGRLKHAPDVVGADDAAHLLHDLEHLAVQVAIGEIMETVALGVDVVVVRVAFQPVIELPDGTPYNGLR